MTTQTQPILIIGKNSKTGSRVDALLQKKGIVTRSVSRSTSLPFDWENPATWAAALQGVKQAYVTYQPDLAVPRAEATLREFVRLAKAQGVEHLVLLSGRGEEGAQKAEQVLINSGLNWNVVRASWFFQNFSESFMAEGILSGVLTLPVEETLEPFIDVDDIAEVAVATLTRPQLRNRLFEVTGPELLTFAQCVERIARASGRDIEFRSVPVDPYIDYLAEQGIPEDYQWLLRELFTEVLDGRNARITHGVEEALGRAPRSFDQYVQKALLQGSLPSAGANEQNASVLV